MEVNKCKYEKILKDKRKRSCNQRENRVKEKQKPEAMILSQNVQLYIEEH